MRARRAALRTLNRHPPETVFGCPRNSSGIPAAGCYGPSAPDNWRAGAKPAQAVFAAIATAIAAGEPVTVGVSAAQFQNARARLPRQVRVVEISSNDAWIRDSGPTFVIDAKGRRRGVDWTFNAWGGLAGGLYFPWDRDDEVAQKVLEIEGRRSLPHAVRARGRRHSCRRSRHLLDHRGVSAQSEIATPI